MWKDIQGWVTIVLTLALILVLFVLGGVFISGVAIAAFALFIVAVCYDAIQGVCKWIGTGFLALFRSKKKDKDA